MEDDLNIRNEEELVVEDEEVEEEETFLRYCADMVGYEYYTYGDIVGSWRNRIGETVEGIGSYLSNLNLFQSCINVADQIGDMSYEMEKALDRNIDEWLRNEDSDPAMTIREIAESLPRNIDITRPINIDITTPSPINIDVKVKIDEDGKLCQIKIKKLGSSKYINVPYDTEKNPFYLQNILDTYFVVYDGFYVGGCLFTDLSKYYENSRSSHLPSWFEDRVEWVKFSYSGILGGMKPCGYKVFREYKKDKEEEY